MEKLHVSQEHPHHGLEALGIRHCWQRLSGAFGMNVAKLRQCRPGRHLGLQRAYSHVQSVNSGCVHGGCSSGPPVCTSWYSTSRTPNWSNATSSSSSSSSIEGGVGTSDEVSLSSEIPLLVVVSSVSSGRGPAVAPARLCIQEVASSMPLPLSS